MLRHLASTHYAVLSAVLALMRGALLPSIPSREPVQLLIADTLARLSFLLMGLWFFSIIYVHATGQAKAPNPDHPVCGSCGYDLTGNVSGICPECGEAVAQGQVESQD